MDLLATLNGLLTAPQFSGSSQLLTAAVASLKAEYADPSSAFTLLVEQDSDDSATEEITKLFISQGDKFETCFGMSDDALPDAKRIFLATIYKTCTDNPQVVMRILKKDLDDCKAELAAARTEVVDLQVYIQETNTAIEALHKRART